MSGHVLARMYDETVEELKRVFLPSEMMMLLDVMNGTLLNSGLMGQQVAANVGDSFALYPGLYEEKWGVQRDLMEIKLAHLNAWQLGVLEVWAERAWESISAESGFDFRAYVAKGKFSVTRLVEDTDQALAAEIDCLEKSKSAFKSALAAQARTAAERAKKLLGEL